MEEYLEYYGDSDICAEEIRVEEVSRRSSKCKKGILSDLSEYPLDDDVKKAANDVYMKMHPRVRRGKIRTRLLFYCTYCAYLELGRDVDTNILGKKIFGLKHGQIQKCYSLFAPLQTGYTPPVAKVRPHKFIASYCQQLGLSEECTAQAVEFANRILNKDKILFQEHPQTVAAGLIKYYADINGISTTEQKRLCEITDRSNVTIDHVYKTICAIDNA